MSPGKESLDEQLIPFDYSPETPLANNWRLKYGEARFYSSKKPKGMGIRTVDDKYRMDYEVPEDMQSAHRVCVDAELQSGAILYVEIEVALAAGSASLESWWFAHVRGAQDQQPTKEPGNEWRFSVAPVDGKTHFEMNVKQEAERVLGGKIFKRIKTIGLRGDMVISSVRLAKHNRPFSAKRKFTLTEKSIGIATLVLALVFGVIAHYDSVRERSPEPGPSKDATSKVAPSKDESKPLHAETAGSIQAMRQLHQVLPLSQVESEKTMNEIPPDSFGFAYTSGFEYAVPLKISSTYSNRLVEIHKLHDGSIDVVGYVGPETFDRLREGVVQGDKFTFYSGSMKGIGKLVAVPLNRIKCSRTRDINAIVALDCNVID